MPVNMLLADAVTKYLNGEGSLWDVAWAALGAIPGTKGLTTLAAFRNAFRTGGALGAGVHVLAKMDESTYDEQDGNTTDDDHPISWCQRYDGGRSFYTGMGHTQATFSEALFLDYMLRPQVIADVSNEVRYAAPNLAAIPLLDPEVRDDPAIYPPEEIRRGMHVAALHDPKLERLRSRLWSRVKTGL